MNARSLLIIGVFAFLVFLGNGGPGASRAPIPEAGFRFAMIEETEDRIEMTAGQREAMFATGPGSIDEYGKQHCVKVDGQPDMLVIDVDSCNPEGLSKLSPIWQKALMRPREEKKHWLIASNGRTGYEGELPKDIDATKAILKRIAGK